MTTILSVCSPWISQPFTITHTSNLVIKNDPILFCSNYFTRTVFIFTKSHKTYLTFLQIKKYNQNLLYSVVYVYNLHKIQQYYAFLGLAQGM